MMKPKKNVLLVASTAALGILLSGCGSGEAEVDQTALSSRNSQRQGSQGAPPATTAGTPGTATGGQ